MCKIIDLETERCKRFLSWASQYVAFQHNNEDIRVLVFSIIQYLVEEKVFTVDELKNELKKAKIYLPEIYFTRKRKGGDDPCRQG